MKIGMRELEGDKQYLQQQNIKLESRVKVLEERHELATRVGMAIGPVRFTMNNFMEHKRTNENWFSPPFYTHAPSGIQGLPMRRSQWRRIIVWEVYFSTSTLDEGRF